MHNGPAKRNNTVYFDGTRERSSSFERIKIQASQKPIGQNIKISSAIKQIASNVSPDGNSKSKDIMKPLLNGNKNGNDDNEEYDIGN